MLQCCDQFMRGTLKMCWLVMVRDESITYLCAEVIYYSMNGNNDSLVTQLRCSRLLSCSLLMRAANK